jgi:hypothetical protein
MPESIHHCAQCGSNRRGSYTFSICMGRNTNLARVGEGSTRGLGMRDRFVAPGFVFPTPASRREAAQPVWLLIRQMECAFPRPTNPYRATRYTTDFGEVRRGTSSRQLTFAGNNYRTVLFLPISSVTIRIVTGRHRQVAVQSQSN